jgi:hypothetical protein
MFLGFPDPDPFVRGTVRIRVFLFSSKTRKKNLDYCFVTFYDILSLKNEVNVASKSKNKTDFKFILTIPYLANFLPN